MKFSLVWTYKIYITLAYNETIPDWFWVFYVQPCAASSSVATLRRFAYPRRWMFLFRLSRPWFSIRRFRWWSYHRECPRCRKCRLPSREFPARSQIKRQLRRPLPFCRSPLSMRTKREPDDEIVPPSPLPAFVLLIEARRGIPVSHFPSWRFRRVVSRRDSR